jgi:hypothetical protein
MSASRRSKENTMPLIFKGQTGNQRFRTWGAVAGAAIGVVGSAMSSDKNGGAGAQSQTKEPWLAAQPWIMSNMAQGQALQQQYQNQPFNPQQQQAYANQYAQSDYMRDLVPSLLGQMQKQPLGYDSANPNARASAWDWNALAGGGGGRAGGSMTAAQAAADEAARRKKPAGDFVNQGTLSGPGNVWAGLMNQEGFSAPVNPFASELTGGYGEFKYGQKAPARGTQAYRDMNEYFAYGGGDPANIYGRRVEPELSERDRLLARLGGGGLMGGGNSGNSVGGSAAADGSGGGGPGAF